MCATSTAMGRTPTASSIDAGERFWVKFHFKDAAGTPPLDQRAGGRDRRPHTRIHAGGSVRGDREVRIPPLESAGPDHAGAGCGHDSLQPVRPHQGVAACRLSADRHRLARTQRNADNYFAEIEQAAFSPSNIVPGIGFSPDKMLQARSSPTPMRTATGSARIMSALPINAPKSPVHHYHKDGAMRFFANNPNPAALLRAQQLRRPRAGRTLPRAAAAAFGRRGPLEPPRGQ